MSAPSPPPSASGTFAPVEFERAVRVEDQIDLSELNEQEKSVVQADEFVVWGRANIEQWNDPGPGENDLYIEMDALEQNLEQLLALQNIDVRVGEPLESYQLNGDATVHVDDDETLTFDAGDELRTQVIREGEPLPGDNGTATEDALWLAANVFGRDDPRGSKFSQKIRLASYYGDVDGFSVTIDKKDWTEQAGGGVRVHDLDFLAVTVGDDEDIKNPGSSFGVAEFQAAFGGALGDVYGLRTRSSGDGAGDRPHNTLKSQLMSGILNRLIGSGKQTLATQAVENAVMNETSIEAEANDLADGENVTPEELVAQADGVTDELEAGAREIAEQADDGDVDGDELENLAADLADELGVDKEVVMAMVEEARDMTDNMDNKPGEGDDSEEQMGEEVNEAVQDLAEALGVSEDEVMDMIDMEGDYEDGEDDEDDMEEQADTDGDDADDGPDIQSLVEQAVAEQMDGDDSGGDDGEFVTEEQLDARLSNLEDSVESQLSEISDTVADDLAESIESQMETATTPGPSGGGVDNEDVESAIDNLADDLGMEVSD